MESRPPRPEPGAALVVLGGGEHAPGLRVDPAYARRGHPEALPEVWLREEVVTRLGRAATGLRERGIGLLVWDGWRSPELQRRLWEEYREALAVETGLSGDALDARARRFVSPPATAGVPPAHQTGGAVDLTLCAEGGEPLAMGGEFDELTDRSDPGFYERPGLGAVEQRFRDRRRLLAESMASVGLWRLPTEWWHFEYGTTAWAKARGVEPLFGPIPAAT